MPGIPSDCANGSDGVGVKYVHNLLELWQVGPLDHKLRYYHPLAYGRHGFSAQLPDTVEQFLKHLQDFFPEPIGSLQKI